MKTQDNTPLFANSVQVRATAKAGVFLTLTTDDGKTVFAPVTVDEAKRLTGDIDKAVTAYQEHEAAANAAD